MKCNSKYPGFHRLFMRGFQFQSSLKNEAPRRMQEKTSGTQDKQ